VANSPRKPDTSLEAMESRLRKIAVRKRLDPRKVLDDAYELMSQLQIPKLEHIVPTEEDYETADLLKHLSQAQFHELFKRTPEKPIDGAFYIAANSRRRFITARDSKEALRYSSIITSALEEALDYDPIRSHNAPRPILWNDDPDFRRDMRLLLEEIRRLNLLLSKKRTTPKSRKAAIGLAKHFDNFLGAYVSSMGKIAAGLTGGAIVGLLYHSGLGQDVIDRMWGYFKISD
jgi:hypothetical protein